MPTTYAHDLFGRRVYKKLNKEIQGKIRENQEIFRIGVHGPDILFYHKPFVKNAVSSLGSRMHYETAAPFFLEGKRRCKELQEDAVLVYYLGFACHYILDSNCHPYIGEYVASGKATHEEIETDFDRYLMDKTGKDPFTFKPGNAICPTRDMAAVIARVLDGVTEGEILKSLRGIRFYTGATVGGSFYRAFLLKAAKLLHCYDFVQGRVIRKEPFASCQESTKELAAIYEKAVDEAVCVLEEYLQGMEDTEHISARFERNYE